ncbi:MAG: helix-turn-helix domain-containing protein [Salinivirgaceae bacterium]|jgi:excisionase family DNA binding protein|nr:helix-turn-helix domain-containing protein [Salinivirgaceae bacterium]
MDEIKEMLAAIINLLSQQNVNGKDILSVEEAARLLNLSKAHVYRLTQTRELPYFCPSGKKYYFRREDLTNYLTRNRTASMSELEAQANAIINRKRRGL